MDTFFGTSLGALRAFAFFTFAKISLTTLSSTPTLAFGLHLLVPVALALASKASKVNDEVISVTLTLVLVVFFIAVAEAETEDLDLDLGLGFESMMRSQLKMRKNPKKCKIFQ